MNLKNLKIIQEKIESNLWKIELWDQKHTSPWTDTKLVLNNPEIFCFCIKENHSNRALCIFSWILFGFRAEVKVQLMKNSSDLFYIIRNRDSPDISFHTKIRKVTSVLWLQSIFIDQNVSYWDTLIIFRKRISCIYSVYCKFWDYTSNIVTTSAIFFKLWEVVIQSLLTLHIKFRDNWFTRLCTATFCVRIAYVFV